MIPGDIIRAAIQARDQNSPIARPKLNYQTFMPATLGFQPRDYDMSRDIMDRIGNLGEIATETTKIKEANQQAQEEYERRKRELERMQSRVQSVREQRPERVRSRPGPTLDVNINPGVRNLAGKMGMTGFGNLWAPLGKINYQVNTPFGPRIHPITHQPSFHTGVDLQASLGDPIYAVSNAVVRSVDRNDPAYGLQTILGLGHGRQAMFGHQSRIIVHPGQRVHRGQIIGYVGSTGLSTGPHLHFELWKRMHPVDPSQYYRRF